MRVGSYCHCRRPVVVLGALVELAVHRDVLVHHRCLDRSQFRRLIPPVVEE